MLVHSNCSESMQSLLRLGHDIHHYIFGIQSVVCELAVANMVYCELNSTAVIASLLFDGISATTCLFAPSWLAFDMTLTRPSVLPVRMYSEFGVNDASIGICNTFRRATSRTDAEKKYVNKWKKNVGLSYSYFQSSVEVVQIFHRSIGSSTSSSSSKFGRLFLKVSRSSISHCLH